MSEQQYLFVYGTLLSEYGDKDSRKLIDKYTVFMGKAALEAKMYMVDYYPGVVPCENDEKYYVKGELYLLKEPDLLFEFLDKYEEYNPMDPLHSEFVRKKTIVKLKSDNESYNAWIYFFNQPTEDLEFLPKGDFMNEYHK
jgi:gamma-glutamylcyclotransferase (GGCT)/AIG2-like uncharacterized protein YtfP